MICKLRQVLPMASTRKIGWETLVDCFGFRAQLYIWNLEASQLETTSDHK